MISSYIKLSLRLLLRNPFFTFINVTGLSVGFAAFFVLWQYSQRELTSDQQWKNSERIYRFGLNLKWTDDKINWREDTFGSNDAAFTNQVAGDYAEIESFTRILTQKNFHMDSYTRDHGSEVSLSSDPTNPMATFIEEHIVYADPNLFSFFSIPMLKGDANTCLNEAGSVVLSEEMAKKYFGDSEQIGKLITLNNKIPLLVSGVFAGLPRNSHLNFNIVISARRIDNTMRVHQQFGYAPNCYLKLKENTDAQKLANRINTELKDEIKQVAFGNWIFGNGFNLPPADFRHIILRLPPGFSPGKRSNASHHSKIFSTYNHHHGLDQLRKP